MVLVVDILLALEENMVVHALLLKIPDTIFRTLAFIRKSQPTESNEQKENKGGSYQQLVSPAEDPDDSWLLMNDGAIVAGDLSEVIISLMDSSYLCSFLLVWGLPLLGNGLAYERDVVTLLVVKPSGHPYNYYF